MRGLLDTAERRRRSLAVLAGLAVSGGLLGLLSGWEGVRVILLALAVAVGLLLEVHLPRGGSVPMGHAFVMALAFAVSSSEYSLITALGILLALPFISLRSDPGVAAGRAAWTAAAATASGLVTAVLRLALDEPSRGYPARTALLFLVLGGIAYLLVDLVGEVRRSRSRPALVLRRSAPVYVSLLCTSSLLGIAYPDLTVAFAALPLLITRFSFQRYSEARRTYEQTIQALGIVPELAGHVSLGHGERTAAYVEVLADELGLNDVERERVVTAARLHHIGHISVDQPGSPGTSTRDAVGRAGGEILRETGFLSSVADLVESVGGADRRAPNTSLVRVAGDFDDIVGEDASRALVAFETLRYRYGDAASQAILDVLDRRFSREPSMVTRAIAQGAPLTEAAAAASRRPV